MASSREKLSFKDNNELLEFLQSFSRNDWAERNGYAGSVDITPKFSIDLKELNDVKRELENGLSDIKLEFSMHQVKAQKEKLKQEIEDLQRHIATLSDAEKAKEQKKLDKMRETMDELNKAADEFHKKTGKTLDNLDDEAKLTNRANELELQRIINGNQINKLQKELNKELDYQNKKYENTLSAQERINHFLDSHVLNTQKFNTGLEEVKAGFSKIKSSVTDLLEPWAKLDQAAASYARNLGMSATTMRNMRANVISSDRANKIAERTGLSPEEQIKLMGAVSGDIGRQIGFNDKQHDLLATGSFLFGEDSAKDYVARLENFGMSTEEAMNRATDLFKESSNTGIAFSKTSKIFLDNLRLAQNYTFKNGVKGLSDMARRSAEIKMNMSEVSRFVDKTSTLEGSLQSAAGLSVLGGSFAMGANPLQMLYNGLQDFEGAEKQMESMLKGLVTFNEDTKQLEMSAFNRQRLRAASQAMGVNYEEMQNMAFAMGREGIVNPILDQLGIDKESDAYATIKNRSYLNDKGEAMINVGREKKAVKDLTTEDIKELEKSNFDDSQNLNDIALSTRGILDLVKGTEEGTKANLAYLAEISGIGDTAKDVVSFFNDNTAILARIQAGILTANILLGIIAAGNGMFRMGASFGGMTPPALSGTPVASGAASASGGALRGASAASAAGASAARGSAFSRGMGRLGMAAIPSALGTMGGLAIANSGTEDLNSGNASKYSSGVGKMTGGGILAGASTGAGLGFAFGPWGALIGGAIGGIAGGIYGHVQAEDMKYRNIIAQRGKFQLQGDYSNHDLEIIATRPSEIDDNIRKQLREKDGISDDIINNYIRTWGSAPMSKAHGGIVTGRGTGTSDSNLAWLSNREYVMPAKATAKPNNRYILDSMRDGADLIPSFKDGGSPIKPNGNHMNIMKVSERGKTKSSGGSDQKLSIGEVKIAPINIGGTIKLDLGQYSKSVDAKELLNNAMFVKNLTDLIAKNLNRQVHFGYDKDTFYKKF